jgi:hypothetical protein
MILVGHNSSAVYIILEVGLTVCLAHLFDKLRQSGTVTIDDDQQFCCLRWSGMAVNQAVLIPFLRHTDHLFLVMILSSFNIGWNR